MNRYSILTYKNNSLSLYIYSLSLYIYSLSLSTLIISDFSVGGAFLENS